jgi:hypothetical protein
MSRHPVPSCAAKPAGFRETFSEIASIPAIVMGRVTANIQSKQAPFQGRARGIDTVSKVRARRDQNLAQFSLLALGSVEPARQGRSRCLRVESRRCARRASQTMSPHVSISGVVAKSDWRTDVRAMTLPGGRSIELKRARLTASQHGKARDSAGERVFRAALRLQSECARMERKEPNALERLLHRWLIEYNPLYLLSAALVLGGVNLISRGLVQAGSLYGQLGVTVIAELYAWTLIGGAALLARIRLRRPAVMLALLAAPYQCDVTLHTETSAYLGSVGAVSSAAWLASFVAKLYALAWAMRLELSRSAIAVPTFGAAGLALLPHWLRQVDAGQGTTIVGLWVFALLAAGLWSARHVKSKLAVDEWGCTVQERALRATWLLWGVLALAHVLFWVSEHRLDRAVLVPVALLLSTRAIRSEARLWSVSLATLLFIALCLPSFFSLSAFMAAVVFGLRALRQPSTSSPQAPPADPYRTRPCVVRSELTLGRASREAMLRLLSGALFASYLSVWTHGWSGGVWPEHVLWLDLLLGAVVVGVVWRVRVFAPLVPLGATCVHLAFRARLISPPDSALTWGATAVGIGFGLLIASLAISWRLRRELVPMDSS